MRNTNRIFNDRFCKVLNDNAIIARLSKCGFNSLSANESRMTLIRLVENKTMSDKDLLSGKGDFTLAKTFMVDATRITRGYNAVDTNEFVFCLKPIVDLATKIVLTKDTDIEDYSADSLVEFKNTVDRYIDENMSVDEMINVVKNIFHKDESESGEDE